MRDCWIWPGDINEAGYGIIHTQTGSASAHRELWEIRHGKLKSWQYLHHTCREKSCINFKHLKVVSPAEHQALHKSDDTDF